LLRGLGAEGAEESGPWSKPARAGTPYSLRLMSWEWPCPVVMVVLPPTWVLTWVLASATMAFDPNSMAPVTFTLIVPVLVTDAFIGPLADDAARACVMS
jgi:hypothetical protein